MAHDFDGDLEDDSDDVLDGDMEQSRVHERMFRAALALFSRRRGHYRSTFRTPSGKRVLTDLAGFCGLMSTAPENATALYLARQEGQRDVFVHIANQLHMREDELVELAKSYAKD